MTASTEENAPVAPAPLASVLRDQLSSLDDTDCFASAWSVALSENNGVWGGRGRGGRGLARRTVQPKDVIVDGVDLMYVADQRQRLSSNAKAQAGTDLRQQALLQGAQLRLMRGRTYGLVGRNGSGKSTLLRRLHHRKIPGLSSDLTTMYLPQEVSVRNIMITGSEDEDAVKLDNELVSPMDVIMHHYNVHVNQSGIALQSRIEELETQLEAITTSPEDESDGNEEGPSMEQLCEDIAALQDQIDSGNDRDMEAFRKEAAEALEFFGISSDFHNTPCSGTLSGGQLKKVLLAAVMLCLPRVDLLLLDEPNHLDVHGLLQLRRLICDMCPEYGTTVLLVSHDVDLLDDVTTDIIQFEHQSRTLKYFADGNYTNYLRVRDELERRDRRAVATSTMQREKMHEALHFMRHQPTPKRGGGARKKANAIRAQRKKIEKHELMQQADGIVVDASAKPVRGAAAMKPKDFAPDKAVQFVFRPTKNRWNSTLITAMDLGHGYEVSALSEVDEKPRREEHDDSEDYLEIRKKDGFLFDCIDLYIEEGSKVVLFGPNSSGKSTFLRLLAKKERPREGTVRHAPGLQVGYFEQHVIDDLLENHGSSSALDYLKGMFPSKPEQDLRGELTAFGLGPAQAIRAIRFLSGGERSRLALARVMLDDPSVLFLDMPTANLDVESVEALVYGLRNWNGTIFCVSHDAHFVRSLEFTHSYVLMSDEGKLRRAEGGIDQYLESFWLKRTP